MRFFLIVMLLFGPAQIMRGQIPEKLLGTWKLEKVQFPEKSDRWRKHRYPVTVTFQADSIIGGHDGCNGVGGHFTLEGDEIVSEDMIMTLLYCNIYDKKNYYGGLPFNRSKFRFEEDQLILSPLESINDRKVVGLFSRMKEE